MTIDHHKVPSQANADASETIQMLGYFGVEEHKDQRAINHDVMVRGRPLSCPCPCCQMTPRSCDQALTSPAQAAARPAQL